MNFVEQVAKNDGRNNGDHHRIHEIFLVAIVSAIVLGHPFNKRTESWLV